MKSGAFSPGSMPGGRSTGIQGMSSEEKKPLVVAITGSSGYLASALLPRLEKDEHIKSVIGVDISPPKFSCSKLVHHPVSIFDFSRLVEIFAKADCVLHLVFHINGLHDKKKLFRLNIAGSKTVIDACGEAKIKKLIFASSLAVYGSHPDNPVPIKETDALRGKGTFFYAEHKQLIEEYLEEFARKNPETRVVRLRLCTTTGPMAYNETVTVYRTPIFIAFRRYQPPVQLLHEEDAANAFHLAIIRDVEGPFNIGSDWEFSAKDQARRAGAKVIYLPVGLTKALARISWWFRLIRFDPSWVDASLFPVVADTSRAARLLGWQPEHKSREIIASVTKKKDRR
jgi:UDP-glucose 4-epimerase